MHRELTDADLAAISSTYHRWRSQYASTRYEDTAGFCASARTAQIASHGYVLTPGRYVGAEEVQGDGDPFEERMTRLVAELYDQLAEASGLEKLIKEKLSELGYGR